MAPQIQATIHDNVWFDLDELRHGFNVFEALYTEHMALEESIAFPRAMSLVKDWDLLTIGREMAQRRMLKPAVTRG